MKKIRVQIIDKPLLSGDAVRGVGVYTRELISHLKKLSQIELVGARPEIIHYPYFNPFFLTLPLSKRAKTVVTIHDLIPLIYPHHYPLGLRGRIRFLCQKFFLKKADGLITVSETSKKDIVRFLEIPGEKIFVTSEAAGEVFKKLETGGWKTEITKRYNLPSRFVLYVGDINYNKNIPGLIGACRIAKIPLVIIGKQAKELETMDLSHPELSHLASHRTEIITHSLRLGYVPETDLVKIYNLATVYCQPSFYEGFGLPIVQAFACGKPVVAAKTQALVEIAGDAALYVDPKEPKEMAEAIVRVLTHENLREALVKKGRARSKAFSWDKTAGETLEVYKKVLSE